MSFSVTTSMFYKKLLEKGPVSAFPEKFHDERITTTQVWNPNLITAANCMYLLTAEDLVKNRELFSNCVLVCCGKPDCGQMSLLDLTCDYLFLEKCRNLTDLTNIIFETINMFRNWRNRITDIFLTSESFSDVLNASRHLLNMEFILFDSNQKCIALSEHFFMEKPTLSDAFQKKSDDYITSLFSDAEHGYDYYIQLKGVVPVPSHTSDGTSAGSHFLFRNVYYHNNYQATLIGRCAGSSLSEGDFQLFEVLGEMLEQYYEKYYIHSRNNSDDARLIQFFSSLVDGDYQNGTDTASLLAYRRWSIHDSWQAIKLQFISRTFNSYSADYFCTMIERIIPECTAFIRGEEIFCVQNLTACCNANVFTSELSAFLRDNLCKIGISNICGSIHVLHQYFIQARLALILGEKRCPSLWLYHFSDYSLDYIIMQITKEYPAKELIHPGLLKLQEHDKKYRTDYFNTLKFYLEENQNAARTAERMFINRSTLLKRCAKIRKLTGINLRDSRIRSYLELSFLLLENDTGFLPDNNLRS